MLNEPSKMWVERLKSGKDKQGTHALRDSYGGLCCLGVACELAVENGVITHYAPNTAYLPLEVRNWLGLKTTNGSYQTDAGHAGYLVNDNDRGKTFEQIAAIIESEPFGLFE